MKRRDFLNYSALSLAAGFGIQLYDFTQNKAFASYNANKRMFVIFLRGGFDGLFAAPSYAAIQSGEMALKRGPMFVAGDYRDFPATHAYHQKLKYHKELSILAADNNVALLPHAGSLNVTRSHFEQMDYIEGGDRNKKLPVGYLTRAMATNPELKSAAVGANVPSSFRGGDPLLIASADNLKAAIEIRKRGDLVARSGANVGMKERLNVMSHRPDIDSECSPEMKNCLIAKNAAHSLALAQISPEADVSNQFKLAAELSKSALKPQIISIDVGGWDIHDDAEERMAGAGGLLANLNQGLMSLKASLGATEWNNSVVVVMSEFGRTIEVNLTGGVDHGRGGLMMVLGGRVRVPSNSSVPKVWDLNNVEGSGMSAAFKVITDYRNVMSQVMIDHLGLDATAVKTLVFPDFASQYVSPGIIRTAV